MKIHGILTRRALLSAVAWFSFACGDTTQPDRVVQLSIDGADTLWYNALGTGIQLTATVSVSEGLIPAVKWRSSNPGVLQVENRGLALSVGNGTSTVTASAEGVDASITAIVNQIATGIDFGPGPGHSAVDERFVVPVNVYVADSNDVPVQNFDGNVHIELENNPGGAVLAGTTTKPVSGGIAQFDDITLSAAGAGYTLRAISNGFNAVSAPFDLLEAPDLVRFHNLSDPEVGTLLDGQSSLYVNDLAHITNDSAVTTVFGPGGGEVVAFTLGRPPSVTGQPIWTAGVDTIDVTFRDPVRIAVTAWIVIGPLDSQRDRAVSQAATTTAVWAAERMGLEFAEFEIVDATGDPDASQFQQTTQCNQYTQARGSIGNRTGRINIYYVGTVDGGRDRGYSCGPAIFMADRSGHELLVHEIGHSFGLGHVDNLDGFNQTNVMHSASSVREFLTEGQVFRSHFNSYSALNDLYGVRPSGQRSCPDGEGSQQCPELIRRIWSDGSFPPNAMK